MMSKYIEGFIESYKGDYGNRNVLEDFCKYCEAQPPGGRLVTGVIAISRDRYDSMCKLITCLMNESSR